MCAVHLVEAPEEVFGSTVDVFTTRVIREVLYQRRLLQFLSEEVNFVEEKDDGCSHEPSRVHNGIEENKGFHHAVLRIVSHCTQPAKLTRHT